MYWYSLRPGEAPMTTATLARQKSPAKKSIPFDAARLDALSADAGIDVLLVTSKHNVQYLFGGYRFFFFDYMDAIGVSRYLPVLIYPRGRPEDSIYLGNRLETHEKELDRFWTPTVETRFWGSTDVMRAAVDHIGRLGPGIRRIGIEAAFMPADAARVLEEGLEAEI